MTRYAVCPDGKVRAFQITGNNTYRRDGTKAACVNVGSKQVGGSVRMTKEGVWRFTPNPNGKHAHLIVAEEAEKAEEGRDDRMV